jgi:uncharacterized surface protein with fasciclin (FAS1) repeats/plastocyanin
MKHSFIIPLLALGVLSSFHGGAQNPCNTPGVVVEASGLSFTPANLTIESGETVVWVNYSGTHNVNGISSTTGANWSNPETFSTPVVSGSMAGVCMGSFTFTVPGTYQYDCSVGSHAASGMVGSITVTPPPSNTVVDIIVNSANHTTLETAVVTAGLAGTLSGEGPFTVFAPTDAAFAALPAGTIEAVLADIDLLTAILTYHVVGGTTLSTDLMDGMVVETLNGESVTVTLTADGVFINDAEVIVADLVADNGVVHVIDAVLLPPTPESNTVVDIIVNSEVHMTLETAVIAAGLAETLSGEGPFTVFAPTDAAFAALPVGTIEAVLADIDLLTAILTYHVVGGTTLSTDLMDGMVVETLNGESVTVTLTADGVFINDAEVIVADLVADNGVVHVIDAVLLPPTPETNTVVDIIVNSEDHTTLEAAVVAAGLVGTLSGDGPFTVFAPTDAAFDLLPAGTLEAVLADTELLTAILTYHVVAGTTLSTDLMDGMVVETLNGESVTVSINAEGVFINDAEVVVADLVADNGVVHVIDAVLLPPTSVQEAQVATWNVFPNPAVDVVRIDGWNNMERDVLVVNAMGQTVAQLNPTQQALSIEALESGLYFLGSPENGWKRLVIR